MYGVFVCCFQWASVASWFLRPEMAGASVPPIVPQPPPMPIRPSRTSSDPPQMAMPPTICTVSTTHTTVFVPFYSYTSDRFSSNIFFYDTHTIIYRSRRDAYYKYDYIYLRRAFIYAIHIYI